MKTLMFISVTCLMVSSSAFADSGANVCQLMAERNRNDYAVSCLETIKNKTYTTEEVAVCMQMATNNVYDQAVICLASAGNKVPPGTVGLGCVEDNARLKLGVIDAIKSIRRVESKISNSGAGLELNNTAKALEKLIGAKSKE